MLYEVITNLMIKDFALQLMDNEGIGDDDVTDFVSVVFSSVITSYSIHYTKLYEIVFTQIKRKMLISLAKRIGYPGHMTFVFFF